MKSSKMLLVFVHILVTALMDAASDDNINTGPSIVEWPACDAEADAKKLEDFVKAGNIDKVLTFFAYHSWEQRRSIVKQYNTIYKKDGSKISAWDHSMNTLLKNDKDAAANMRDMGYFEMGDYLAHRIRHSFDQNTIFSTDYGYISIICTSTGELMKSIMDHYWPIQKEPISAALDMEEDDAQCRALLNLLTRAPFRSNAKADDAKTAALVKSIPQSRGHCENDKDFYNMMRKDSFEQIRAVGQKYEAEFNTSVVDKVMLCKDHLGNALTRIMYFSMNPGRYFAEELNDYITGKGDKINNAGPRIILSRSEIDLADIRTAYLNTYKSDLGSAFKGRLGEYNQKLMKLLVDGNRDPKKFDSFK